MFKDSNILNSNFFNAFIFVFNKLGFGNTRITVVVWKSGATGREGKNSATNRKKFKGGKALYALKNSSINSNLKLFQLLHILSLLNKCQTYAHVLNF